MKKIVTLLFLLNALLSFSGDYGDGIFAIVSTDKGEIVIQLAYDKAPVTVANFMGLAEGSIENTAREIGVPFYDGLNFHRVEKGALIQGGCPIGNGMGNPGYKFNNEIHKDLSHDKAGVVAMANSGKNTNGCQFYILIRPLQQLDKKYSIFGQVVQGQGVVELIEKNDKILSVKIVRSGEAANAFDVSKNFTEKQRKKL